MLQTLLWMELLTHTSFDLPVVADHVHFLYGQLYFLLRVRLLKEAGGCLSHIRRLEEQPKVSRFDIL